MASTVGNRLERHSSSNAHSATSTRSTYPKYPCLAPMVRLTQDDSSKYPLISANIKMRKYKGIHKCIATSRDSFPFELSFPLQVLHAKMHVRPLIRSDIPAVAEITNQTFSKDELFAWLYPHQDRFPDDLRRFQLIRLRTRLVERGSNGFVAESEEGDAEWTGKPEVLGFAFYIRNGNDAGAKKWRHDPPINSW